LVLKVFIEEDLQIGCGREFHAAGLATLNILFPNCEFALLTTKSCFEALVNKRH